ncbi:hypothetical protein CJ030_MR2G006906 [Morella rubra]|uniref:Uncharacterized protein n=1 Tax=Morella rubra TaxID=262757 RepID=A0A6A1WD74_9ROSI|nr:hypothetical protein CJ030_MR2G006906 [Morella rubra]
MTKRHRSSSSSFAETSTLQDPESPEDYMTQEEQLKKERVKMLSQSVIVECEVCIVDFEELKYMGRSIGDILDDQGCNGYLKRDLIASVDLVREFYAALLDVEDIEAMLWTITVREVTFQLSPNILAAFMGLQRPIGAYPTVEMANKPDAEDIFRTFTGQNVVLFKPFVRQKFMLPFWRILHLIFAYDIE